MNNIIVMYEENDKELNTSLYDFIDELYKCKVSFLISYVKDDEYAEMQKELSNGFLYERLASTTKDELKYNKFRYLMASNRYENNVCITDYNNPDKKGSYILDENGFSYNENKLPFLKDIFISRQARVIRAYTTETYDDVVSYYQNRYSDVSKKVKTK